MIVITNHNQNLADIAVQHLGSVFAVFDLSVENGISVTDDLSPGTSLKVPLIVENRVDQVAQFFTNNKMIIATAFLPKDNNDNEFEFPQGEFPISL